jgi:DNA invertase Pin-like site-specific DNA recombinase
METTTAIYVRSTAGTSSGDEQRELTLDFAVRGLGLDREEIVVLSDTPRTDGDGEPAGDEELFDLAAEGGVERVIVSDASRIASNMRELNDRVRTLIEDGVAVHIVEPGLRFGAIEEGAEVSEADRPLLRALGVAAELEASVTRERTKEGIAAARAAGKHVGRPPFGFDSDGEGGLVPNDDFETALAVIEQIEAGESKRSTARDAGITRATVRNIVDRKELYRSA